MYFLDRTDAGRQLAQQLGDFETLNTAVVAMSKGAILVAEQIAKKLHSGLYIFAVEDNATDTQNPATALTSSGIFSYNTGFSLGDIEHDKEAVRFFTDQRHLNDFLALNHIAGKDGTIPGQLLKRHNIILVSDGLSSALSLQIATEFFAPLSIKKLVLATPIASVEAIDKMHILVDQIFCLMTQENYLGNNHYYQNNQIPDDLTVVDIMQKIVLNWQNHAS